jgi:hypothetical protein
MACKEICQTYRSMALQPFVGPWSLFGFLILYTVGMTFWTGDEPTARPLPIHTTTQTQNKRRQTYMPWLGFEPTDAVFEQLKTFYALNRAATVIGNVPDHFCTNQMHTWQLIIILFKLLFMKIFLTDSFQRVLYASLHTFQIKLNLSICMSINICLQRNRSDFLSGYWFGNPYIIHWFLYNNPLIRFQFCFKLVNLSSSSCSFCRFSQVCYWAYFHLFMHNWNH